MTPTSPKTARERAIWNAAIRAAQKRLKSAWQKTPMIADALVVMLKPFIEPTPKKRRRK